jgi:hypothetical protein
MTQEMSSPIRKSPPGANCCVYAPRRFNERSKQRFAANRRTELSRHLGRDPSYPERIIIARVIAIEWDLRRTDAMIDDGVEPSGHLLRARLAAENRLRLDLASLGMAPRKPPQPSLAEIVARHRSGVAA